MGLEDGADGEHACDVSSDEFAIPDYYKYTKAQLDHEAKMFVTMTKKACEGSYNMTLQDKACFECFKRAHERMMSSDVQVQDYKTFTKDELVREVDRFKVLVDGAAQGENALTNSDLQNLQALAGECKRRH